MTHTHCTQGVKLVMEATCIMFDEKPKMVDDPNKLGKKVREGHKGSGMPGLLSDVACPSSTVLNICSRLAGHLLPGYCFAQ